MIKNFKERKETKYIIVHCSATRPSQDFGVREIRQMHRERGFLDVGYHYIIKRNGDIENGRKETQLGAHCKGLNDVSVGVCLVGGIDESGKPEANFTEDQMKALKLLLMMLQETYLYADIRGHHDFAAKACPSFHVKHWIETGEVKDHFEKEI